ncbi:D site-binding protein-like [Ptychodera flava]|uniref:D site-binding protein-like n=1 Tax=Ptychodera flava TaxID=63121 RepID=UPI003969F47B
MPNEAASPTAAQVMHHHAFGDVNMDMKTQPLESDDVVSVHQAPQASAIDMSSRGSSRSAAESRPQAHTDSDSDGESSSGSTSTGTRGVVRGSPSQPKVLYKQHFPYPASVINAAMRQNATRPLRPFKPYTASHEMLSYAGFGTAGLHPYAALSMRMGMTPLPTIQPGLTQGLAPHLMTLANEATKLVPQAPRVDPSSLERKRTISQVSSSPNTASNAHADTAISGKPTVHNESGDNSKQMESIMAAAPSTSSSSSLPGLSSLPSMCSSSAAAAALHSDRLSGASRKRRSLPDEMKDESYWERRRKNNDAAKRSRDARKAKEDEVAIRAALLEQENIRLRVEVAALKEETARLRCVLYNS